MLLPNGSLTKGDGDLKQAVLSLVAILLAAAVFTLMVLYTIWVIQTAQMQILTGELCSALRY